MSFTDMKLELSYRDFLKQYFDGNTTTYWDEDKKEIILDKSLTGNAPVILDWWTDTKMALFEFCKRKEILPEAEGFMIFQEDNEWHEVWRRFQNFAFSNSEFQKILKQKITLQRSLDITLTAVIRPGIEGKPHQVVQWYHERISQRSCYSESHVMEGAFTLTAIEYLKSIGCTDQAKLDTLLYRKRFDASSDKDICCNEERPY